MYKKRPGTSGIRGHLYETKLLSLLLYRVNHNDDIEEFYLASNVDGIGAFDDICFRVKLKGFNRPIAVFIQAKHRENTKALTLNNENDLAKYFDSYLKIRRTFKSSNEDVLFAGEFDETECLFVIYTTANGDQNKKMPEYRFVSNLNDLIGTDGILGYQPSFNNEKVEFLCKLAVKEQMISLAVTIANFINNKVDFRTILNDELVLRYHVVLAQRIILVSDVHPEGHRVATFREDFLSSNEEFIISFKERLFVEVLKKRKVDKDTILLYLFIYATESPTPETLSKLIGSVITYNKHGKLEFMNKNTEENLKQQLNKVVVCQSDVDAAIHKAAKKILLSRSFKVPAAFGNKDLTISGNDKKIERRLDYLVSQFCDLVKNSQRSKITIDETLGKGFLKLNGGIASAIGNILVLDDDSQLMKFTDNCDFLQTHARKLLQKLKVKIQDLDKYRFEMKIKNFPKFSLQYSEHDKNMVKDFLNKLIFYSNQADENSVEEILKNEIENHQCNIGYNFRIRSDAIFLTYHDEIQKWWMLPDKGHYLTKDIQTHHQTIKKIAEETLMCLMNVIYRNNINHDDYTFKEDALLPMKFDVLFLDTVIVTDTIALTVANVLQSVKNKDHVVLDLEYILNLPMNDFNELCAELMNTCKNKILIFVFENVRFQKLSKTLCKITKAVQDKIKIIITNPMFAEIIKKYFLQTVDLVINERNNLMNMSEESRNSILKNTTVFFQDKIISLDLILDHESVAFVEGDVLNKIICKETIVVGESLGNSNYEEIKHLYVNRRVRRGREPNFYDTPHNTNEIFIETLHDLPGDVVLITAKPGMGKSTLLTHISLKTKELDPTLWIVRINLLEYSREFSEWQENKSNINILETLNFMCQIIVSKKRGNANKLTIELEESNGIVYLKECAGDQWTIFELKLFLHFYNRGRMIFLFDGFDEICPHYSTEVIQFLKSVKSYPRKHKLWIASRSYNKVKSILQQEFGISYEILNFTSVERQIYLNKFWRTYLLLNEFNEEQLENVHDFIQFMRERLESFGKFYVTINKLPNLPLYQIYFDAFDYIRSELMYKYIPLWKFESTIHENVFKEIFTRLGMRYNGDTDEFNSMLDFIGTPLHLYLHADYFVNEIKDGAKKINKWNLDTNTFRIYERFLETKLKIIRFQEKNKMDLYNPDIIITYEKERADFISKHKKMAAYAIFHRQNHELFSRKELKEIKNMIKLIKKGGEKTGLIYSVANNIPIFVHRSFAEYFAVEYFCDLLKVEKCYKKQETMIDFILNVMFFQSPANVRNILDSKIKIDDELVGILKKNGKFIFELMMEQTKGYPAYGITDVQHEYYEIKYDLSLNVALSDNLNNFVKLLIAILETHIKKENIDDFIKTIDEASMFITAVRVKCTEFIAFSLDIVRKIDKSKFSKLFSSRNFSCFLNLSLKSNEEIIKMYERIVMLSTSTTTPYFMNNPHQDSHLIVMKQI